VTIKDVAAATGLSIATVSNVINHPQIVKPNTQARVQECIDRLGFVPDSAARQLRLGVTSAVGAVMRDIDNAYTGQAIHGLEDGLREARWMLMVSSSRGDTDLQSAQVEFFERQRVAGVVVRPVSEDYTELEAAHERGMNIVLLDTTSPVSSISSVDIDHAGGATLAFRHLLEIGRRHILYLEDDATCTAVGQVNVGVAAAVKEAGLNYNAVVTKVGFDSATSGAAHKVVADYLAAGNVVDGVFTGNEFMAFGAHRAARAAGLGVDDCTVIGYGDSTLGKHNSLPIGLVRLPMYKLGERAAQLAMHPSEFPEHVALLPQLELPS
jgi:LacI family transcriptional regulator